MLYVFVIRKKNKETEDDNATKEKRQFTDKQQRYIDSLRSPSNGIPYKGMYYISESTHMALAEFIEEVFSFDANSQENHFKVQCLLSKNYTVDYKVLPDGHQDIIWPLTNTSNFHRDRHDAWWSFRELMKRGNKTTLFFIKDKNDLSKLLEFYFKKANIEIRTLSKIKPFSDDVNKYVFIDPSSKEFAITYFLIRNNLKMKDALGMKYYPIPENGSFKVFREKAYERYRFKNEKEFMKSLIGHLFSADQIYASFYARGRTLIEDLAQSFNYDRPDAGVILSEYRKIENELRIELFGTKMKTYKRHLKRFKNTKILNSNN